MIRERSLVLILQPHFLSWLNNIVQIKQSAQSVLGGHNVFFKSVVHRYALHLRIFWRWRTGSPEEYRIRYSDRVVPSSQVLDSINDYWKQDQLRMYKKRVCPNIGGFAKEDILARVEENTEISTRRLAAETGLSRWKVSKVLKDNTFHPYLLR